MAQVKRRSRQVRRRESSREARSGVQWLPASWKLIPSSQPQLGQPPRYGLVGSGCTRAGGLAAVTVCPKQVRETQLAS